MLKPLLIIVGWMFLIGIAQAQREALFSGGIPVFHREKCTIPFELKGHKIYVPVSLQQSRKTYQFILDTGAFSSISQELAEELQLNTDRALSAGTEIKQAHLVKEQMSVQLGDMEVKNFRMISMDFSYFYQTDPDLDGFLGSDFLRYFYVHINNPKQELVLSQYPFSYPSDRPHYQIKLEGRDQASRPKTQCQINDRWSYEALIDTGAPFTIVFPLTLLNKQDWRRFPLIESIGVMASWPNSSIQKNYLTRIEHLKLGMLELNNIPVIFSNTDDIVVGQELLSQFQIYLNYPDYEMILVPAGKIFTKSNYFSTGLKVSKANNGRTFIEAIWKGSAAEQAGLLPGTEIIKINSIAAAGLSLTEINRLLNDDRITAIEMMVKKDNEERKVLLTKAFLLPDNN